MTALHHTAPRITAPEITAAQVVGPNSPHALAASGARFRRTVIAMLAVLALTALVVVGSTGAASAHDGHRTESEAQIGTRSTAETTIGAPRTAPTTRIAQLAIDRFHLARINDADLEVFVPRRTTGDLRLVSGRGQANPLDADCFVDFDDDQVIDLYMADGAEDTFYDSHWYQKCFTFSHPAVAVKYMDWGHFHLGYEDDRIGPCAGSLTDWGRKEDPFPTDDDDLGAWIAADCVAEIDPVTEPRSGISPHLPGERAQILAYDADGYLPFQLRSLEVVRGEVEVCHLPSTPFEAAGPGGSPWQCTTLDPGYYDLAGTVPHAIEVRIEFLTHGEIDNIGVDLL